MLNVRILDPAIARIYIISQLCLQYLLFCVKFLDKSVYSLRENSFNDQKKILKLEELVEKRDEEIAQLQKKVKRQETLNQPIFSCTKCTKNFLSAALLNNHILRKHPPAQVLESKDKDSNLINTIKLELEIKQLKEKLNSTEKDLMESKEKAVSAACEKCLQNAQRKFQNVAVQSNFEEKEKDDIEKDAIYELLNNQMKHFEEWKSNEETRYRLEISDLRAKLDETIETLKQVATQKEVRGPSPAPRMMKIAEKCVGTSKSVDSLPEPKSDETVWKERYEELEKMYEEHQQRMVSTVTSIEQVYNEKMSNIEQTVKQLKDERVKINEKPVERIEKPETPLSPKVIKQIHVHQPTTSSESNSEDEIQAKPMITNFVKPQIKSELKPAELKLPEKSKTILQTFSSQKFLTRNKKEKLKKLDPPMPYVSPREQAVMLFEKQLKDYSIDPQSTRLSKSEFNRVHSAMVNTREENKKKNKSFYLTRKKLQSSVDKIFQQKSNLKKRDKNEKLKSPEKSHGMSDFKAPPEMNIPTKEIVKQTFRSDLDRMLKSKLLASSTSNKQHEETFEPPMSSSKKKVLFDLKEEDDSDYDLSSFTSEMN